jgi:pimeloyl-ACP methyl ester carboxylesterase
MLAPLSGAWAQEALETVLPEVPQEPVVPEVPPEPLVSPEETPTRTISDESGDVTAPTVIQAKTLYNPTERSAGPRSKIEDRTTAINIYISDELNESPEVRVDFSLLGGSSSVGPNEGISSLFSKYIYYDGPAITVPDGTYSLPYSVSDPHGNTVVGTVPITIDESPPSIENFTVSYPAGKTSATSTDTITLSGSFSDASSPAATKVFDALVYEYDEAGLPAYFVPTVVGTWLVPSASDSSAGPFSFELPLSTALLEGGFKPNAKTFDIVFYVQDGAGLVTTATSTRLLIGDSPTATTTGVSNVLFLPGIKGSRLYDETGAKLWEPFGNHDIEDLFLDGDGKSIGSVYTKPGEIIDSVALFMGIYGSFINSMDSLKEAGTIADWRAVPYDWRLSLPDIVNGGVESDGYISYAQTTETPYLRQTLEELAASSTSKRVTIIAHSNGGLVAKELMRQLGDAETARLIDKVIFVAVPQSGAPQALGALLYGYKEGLPWWFPGIVSIPTARQFAENSPMGYHLLPSDAYFRDVQDQYHSVVSFGSGESHRKEREAYGTLIESFDELKNFALATEGGREKPNLSAFWSANILNPTLLEYGQTIHDSLDSWTPPPGVTVYQIAGWGQDTVAGIEYYETCVLSVCVPHYRPTFVEDGDGVVPVPSALMMGESENVKRYWVDLFKYNSPLRVDRDHGNILEIPELRSFVEQILSGDTSTLPEFIVNQQPETAAIGKKLRFFLHSPLTLEISDQSGNRVGPNEDGSEDEEIQGAEYGRFGEVQYISVPAEAEYNLRLDGYDTGTFSLDIQEVVDGNIVATTTFANLPTTSSTLVLLSINGDIESATPLQVDEDGNGTVDISLESRVGETTTYTETSTEVVTQTESTGSIASGGQGGSRAQVTTSEEPELDTSETIEYVGTENTPNNVEYTNIVNTPGAGTDIEVSGVAIDEQPISTYSQTAAVINALPNLDWMIGSLLAISNEIGSLWEDFTSWLLKLLATKL